MYKRIILAAAVAVVALCVGLGATSLVLAEHQAPKQKLLHQKSFGEWEYRATQTERTGARLEVTLSIESTLRGKAPLTKLLAKQKGAAQQLLQTQRQLRAIVIPDTPLAPNRLPEFAKKHGLTIASYNIIALAANGELITIFGAPEGDLIFPEHSLQTIVQGIERNTQTSLHIQGVVAIDTHVTKESLMSLETDRDVLGVDLTAAIALDDLVQETHLDPANIQVMPSSLYWANLEEN